MAVDMDMEPAIWGALPEQLLHLVFSRLSAAGICQLRLLSKGWKRDIDSIDSEFSMVLEKTTYPSMFGLIAWKDHGEPCGYVFDLKGYDRHAIEIDAAEDYLITIGAADGGLVCFVSESKKKPMFLVVMNPLTRKKVELPPLLSMDGVVPNVRPTMVQLTMDRRTQQYYKVIVVSTVESGGFAQVYDSKMKGWTVVGSGEQTWDRIFGFEYHWSDEHSEYYTAERLGPCVYDFAAGGLQYFGSGSIAPSGSYGDSAAREIITHAFWKNRVFVFCVDRRPVWPVIYFIEEYVLEKNATAWVKVRRIGEDVLTPDLYRHDADESHKFTLHACNGYLMLFGGWDRLAYFYSISKPRENWQDLPSGSDIDDEDHDGEGDDDKFVIEHDHSPLDLMSELRWNATP